VGEPACSRTQEAFLGWPLKAPRRNRPAARGPKPRFWPAGREQLEAR